MEVLSFWNNKGGTGKTSLAFQTICAYAKQMQDKKVLVIDACPQANLSELLLGGLENKGASNLLKRQGEVVRASIGGYFQRRIPSPFDSNFITDKMCNEFLTNPSLYNDYVPENISLLCGDPLLELQANAVSTLSNTQLPEINTWITIIDWIADFIHACDNEFDICFIDTNPSFSIYTQMSIAATQKLIMPVMADDSSRRAIMNAFSLIYSLKLPSDIYMKYAFKTKLEEAERPLPKVHLLVKNRMTQYMTDASGYAAVLQSLERELSELQSQYKQYFSFTDMEEGLISIRDFQTTGVVAFARGCPFYSLKPGHLSVQNKRVHLNKKYIAFMIEDIQKIVDKIG